MAQWWKGMSWAGKFLAVMFAYSIAFFVGVKLLHEVGIEVFEPRVGEPRAQFSRTECISRHQSYYFDRNPDMVELSNDQMGIVARACAVEESEYYHGE